MLLPSLTFLLPGTEVPFPEHAAENSTCETAKAFPSCPGNQQVSKESTPYVEEALFGAQISSWRFDILVFITMPSKQRRFSSTDEKRSILAFKL
jgi:hypothetical protein